jgi:hypothetical protein
MTKTIKIAAALLGASLFTMTSPAGAQPRTYVSADCEVSLLERGSWRQINNICLVALDHETNATFVKMGRAILVIKRDPHTYGLGRLYTIDSRGNTSEGETAVAQGACWVGITLKFCSP